MVPRFKFSFQVQFNNRLHSAVFELSMALHRGRIDEVPQGTIQLTEEEAKEYQYRIIFGWKPQRDVYAC